MKKFNTFSIVTAFVLSFVVGPIAVRAAGPAAVELGSANNFAILAKTGISTTGTSSVVGDIGVSPAAATYITGFALNLPAGGAYATSARVSGKVFAPGYAVPTPANISTAIGAMQTAYTNAAGRTNPTATELGAGNIGGKTLAPGLYKWSTGVTIPTDLTLSGGANDVWIFQIAQKLTVSSGVKVTLSGGAQASNVFWIVADQTTIGTTATFTGTILDQTAIVLNTGAKLNGRAFAQTAVTLDSNTVSIPGDAVITVTPIVTPATTTSSNTNNGGGGYISTATTPTTLDAGCASGNKFSTTTGFNCTSNASPTMPTASAFGQQVRTIARSLGQGSGGADVTALQQFLITQNKGQAAKALANVGATAFFGGMTRAALAEFQASVGISPALGNFGSITRAYVSAHY